MRILKRLFVVFLVLINLVSFKTDAITIGAKAGVVIGGDFGETIFEYNAHDKLPMASTTKIMTALLLCEYGNFEKEILVTKQMVAVEGSSMGLLEGDRVTLHDLLYGIMLASGNDAANTAAICISGSVEEFVILMNKRAKELGLLNTNFVTPSGLDAEEHYTTAHDLAKLTFYALKNEEFKKAAATYKATLCYGNPPYKRTLTNHNRLLNEYDGAIGVKTGFTKKSGRCLVSAAEKDGKLAISVTLNCPDDWNEHKKMLDFGFSSLKDIEIIPENQTLQIPVINSVKKSVKAFCPSLKAVAFEDSGFEYSIKIKKSLEAPINKGDKIGEIKYIKNGEALATFPITLCESAEEIKLSPLQKIGKILKHILYGLWEK